MAATEPRTASQIHHRVEIEGHTLVAIEHAPASPTTAAPLVLLHDIGMSPRVWPHILPSAMAGRRCLALALPAHAPSCPPHDFAQRPLRPGLFSQALIEVVSHVIGYEIGFDILGHSLGSYAALAMAAAAPERIGRVAGVSGFAQGHFNGLYGLLQWLARCERPGSRAAFNTALAGLTVSPSIAGMGLRSTTARPRAFHRWTEREPFLRTLMADLEDSRRSALRHLFAEIHEYDLRDRLDRIHAPVLIVHGTNDPIVPFAQARILSHRIAHAELVRLEGIGHMPFGEAADAFQQTINQWFDL